MARFRIARPTAVSVVARLVLSLAALGACGDGDPPAPDPVARVAVEPAAATLVTRDSLALTAMSYAAGGAVLTGRGVVFTSENAAVATVSARGVVVGVAPGRTAIQVASAERPAVTARVDIVVEARTYPLTLSVGGAGHGALTARPLNAVCRAATCTVPVPEGTVVTVDAAPDSASTFGGFGGACAAATLPCRFAMDGPRTVSVDFGVFISALSVSVLGDGTVTSSPAGIACRDSCTAAFPAGTVVTLSAQPAAGSMIERWLGPCGGTSPACTLTLAVGPVGVGVRFTPFPPIPLRVTASGPGSVESSPFGLGCPSICLAYFPPGTTVTLQARPARETTFAGWWGACAGASLTCVVSMDSARAVAAAFTAVVAPLPVALTVRTAGSGTVTSLPAGISCPGVCTATFAAGAVVTLSAHGMDDDPFVGWSGGCAGTAPTCAVTSSQTVQATFLQGAGFVDGGGRVTSQPVRVECTANCPARP